MGYNQRRNEQAAKFQNSEYITKVKTEKMGGSLSPKQRFTKKRVTRDKLIDAYYQGLPIISHKGLYEQALKKLNRSKLKQRQLIDTAIVLVTREMVRKQYSAKNNT